MVWDLVFVAGLTSPAKKLAEVRASIWRFLLLFGFKLKETVHNYFVLKQNVGTASLCLSYHLLLIVVERITVLSFACAAG